MSLPEKVPLSIHEGGNILRGVFPERIYYLKPFDGPIKKARLASKRVSKWSPSAKTIAYLYAHHVAPWAEPPRQRFLEGIPRLLERLSPDAAALMASKFWHTWKDRWVARQDDLKIHMREAKIHIDAATLRLHNLIESQKPKVWVKLTKPKYRQAFIIILHLARYESSKEGAVLGQFFCSYRKLADRMLLHDHSEAKRIFAKLIRLKIIAKVQSGTNRATAKANGEKAKANVYQLLV